MTDQERIYELEEMVSALESERNALNVSNEKLKKEAQEWYRCAKTYFTSKHASEDHVGNDEDLYEHYRGRGWDTVPEPLIKLYLAENEKLRERISQLEEQLHKPVKSRKIICEE